MSKKISCRLDAIPTLRKQEWRCDDRTWIRRLECVLLESLRKGKEARNAGQLISLSGMSIMLVPSSCELPCKTTKFSWYTVRTVWPKSWWYSYGSPFRGFSLRTPNFISILTHMQASGPQSYLQSPIVLTLSHSNVIFPSSR